MESIELCSQCGEMMVEKEGYLECPSCAKRIERKESNVLVQKGLPFGRKLAISVVLDILDLTIFRLPVIGSLYDAFCIAVAIRLFGGLGFLSFGELFELTDQFDAQIPTLTIICLLQYFYERMTSSYSH